MRTIKFRAAIDEVVHGKKLPKDFVYGSFVFDFETEEDSYIVDERGVKWGVDINTIGQFTGLKDKDGVEIYEGDRVFNLNDRFRDLKGETEAIVLFEDGSFNLRYKTGGFFWGSQTAKSYRVIGNIYEEKEE